MIKTPHNRRQLFEGFLLSVPLLAAGCFGPGERAELEGLGERPARVAVIVCGVEVDSSLEAKPELDDWLRRAEAHLMALDPMFELHFVHNAPPNVVSTLEGLVDRNAGAPLNELYLLHLGEMALIEDEVRFLQSAAPSASEASLGISELVEEAKRAAHDFELLAFGPARDGDSNAAIQASFQAHWPALTAGDEDAPSRKKQIVSADGAWPSEVELKEALSSWTMARGQVGASTEITRSIVVWPEVKSSRQRSLRLVVNGESQDVSSTPAEEGSLRLDLEVVRSPGLHQIAIELEGHLRWTSSELFTPESANNAVVARLRADGVRICARAFDGEAWTLAGGDLQHPVWHPVAEESPTRNLLGASSTASKGLHLNRESQRSDLAFDASDIVYDWDPGGHMAPFRLVQFGPPRGMPLSARRVDAEELAAATKVKAALSLLSLRSEVTASRDDESELLKTLTQAREAYRKQLKEGEAAGRAARMCAWIDTVIGGAGVATEVADFSRGSKRLDDLIANKANREVRLMPGKYDLTGALTGPFRLNGAIEHPSLAPDPKRSRISAVHCQDGRLEVSGEGVEVENVVFADLSKVHLNAEGAIFRHCEFWFSKTDEAGAIELASPHARARFEGCVIRLSPSSEEALRFKPGGVGLRVGGGARARLEDTSIHGFASGAATVESEAVVWMSRCSLSDVFVGDAVTVNGGVLTMEGCSLRTVRGSGVVAMGGAEFRVVGGEISNCENHAVQLDDGLDLKLEGVLMTEIGRAPVRFSEQLWDSGAIKPLLSETDSRNNFMELDGRLLDHGDGVKAGPVQ